MIDRCINLKGRFICMDSLTDRMQNWKMRTLHVDSIYFLCKAWTSNMLKYWRSTVHSQTIIMTKYYEFYCMLTPLGMLKNAAMKTLRFNTLSLNLRLTTLSRRKFARERHGLIWKIHFYTSYSNHIYGFQYLPYTINGTIQQYIQFSNQIKSYICSNSDVK